MVSRNDSCIRVRELSSAAQTEARNAIETGKYEACGGLALLDEINLSNGLILIYEGTTYEPIIAHGDAGPQAECSSTYTLTMKQISRSQTC